MELEFLEIVQGCFSLIFVVISIIIGIKLIFKYFEKKNRELYLVGITWIGISTPWMGGSISFIMFLLIDSLLSDEIRFIIGNVFIPAVVVIWLIVFTDLFYKKQQKYILIIFSVLGICFEIVFFIFLFTDPSLIGTFVGPFRASYTPFIRIIMAFYASVALITGVIFALKTIKADISLEANLRGKFILIAFPSFAVGSILDVLIPITPITIITRLILISSALEFYCGFSLPKFIKRHFLEKNNKKTQ